MHKIPCSARGRGVKALANCPAKNTSFLTCCLIDFFYKSNCIQYNNKLIPEQFNVV